MAKTLGSSSIITLNQIPTCDGKGKVAYYEDFESLYFTSTFGAAIISRWTSSMQGAAGAGGYVQPRTNWSKSGHRSVTLMTHAVLNSQPTLTVYLPRPQSRRIGFEFSFVLGASIQDITLWSYIYNRDRFEHEAFLRIEPQSAQLSYWDVNGGWASLSGLETAPIAGFTYTVKLVIDQESGQYARVWFNGVTYLMNGVSYMKFPMAFAYNYILLQIIARPSAAVNAAISVDDFILTEDEP